MTPLPYLPTPLLLLLKERLQHGIQWRQRWDSAITSELVNRAGGVGGHVEATLEPVEDAPMGGDDAAMPD